MYKLVDFLWLGLSHSRRLGRSAGIIATVFFGLALVSSTLWRVAVTYQLATRAHLTDSGMNRITISKTDSLGLRAGDVGRISLGFSEQTDNVRVVPQITTVVYLGLPDKSLSPFLATSYCDEDPLLGELPSLWQSTDNAPGIVVSPDILRRLGGDIDGQEATCRVRVAGIGENRFTTARELESGIDFRARETLPAERTTEPEERCVTSAGHSENREHSDAITTQPANRILSPADFTTPYENDENHENHENHERFSLPVARVVGDLGNLGVRIPYDILSELRCEQTKCQIDELEINAIHLLIPADMPMQAAIKRLKQVDSGFQLSSPYFERGKQREFATAALSVGGPILVLLLFFNAAVAVLLSLQRIRADRRAIGLAKLYGATVSQIVAWSVLPYVAYSFCAGVAGMLTASLLLSGQAAGRLQSLAGVDGQTATQPVLLLAILGVAALLVHLVPALQVIVRADLDRGLNA